MFLYMFHVVLFKFSEVKIRLCIAATVQCLSISKNVKTSVFNDKPQYQHSQRIHSYNTVNELPSVSYSAQHSSSK